MGKEWGRIGGDRKRSVNFIEPISCQFPLHAISRSPKVLYKMTRGMFKVPQKIPTSGDLNYLCWTFFLAAGASLQNDLLQLLEPIPLYKVSWPRVAGGGQSQFVETHF